MVCDDAKLEGDAHAGFREASVNHQRSGLPWRPGHSRVTFAVVTGTRADSERFRLRTFGTLTLSRSDNSTVLGRHGHHRRRLALLALLAAAGQRGWSRDQLLLFFWPEATQARARHSLDQLLYALRSSLGEDLFATANPVVLNDALISSDVTDFIEAFERDELEAVVRQYRGPFLDGFYLDDAPGFERWVEEERARLKSRYASALERLAQAADSIGDHARAMRWWRLLVDADPISARSAAGFIQSLVNAGDHAAALQFAEQYESTVARELGTSVGPTVAKLVTNLRASSGSVRVAVPRLQAESVPGQADADPMIPPMRAATPERVRRWISVRRLVAMAGAAAGVAAIAMATRSLSITHAPPSSIAVLPFDILSSDSADDLIVNALSEELITALSRIRKLRVTGRQSSFMFRDSKVSASQIGDSLGVAHLLEGSIQPIGEQLRVRVRLVDVSDGALRWSTQYDFPRRDVFALQGDVAAAVARELGLELSASAEQKLRRGLTRNIPAYELYLSGRDPVNLRSQAGVTRGMQQLEQAVALDSSFAAAWAAMPYMYFGLVARARDQQEAQEIQQRAEAAARKAIALDPSLPEAHAGLAVALVLRYTNMAGAEAALRQAVALGGTARIRENLSRVLMWSGRHREALEEATRAAEEDPLSPTAVADLGEALCVNRRYGEGLAQLERVARLPQPLLRVPGYRAVCYLMQEKWSMALQQFGDSIGTDPWSMLAGYAVARSGDTAHARAMEREALSRWRRTGLGAPSLVYIAAGLRDFDKAFQWIERMPSDPNTTAIMYPFLGELHADPRFERYRKRLGLTQ
jgi:TolB-like protein/DNA-binding SARP family transcriptional activator